MKQTRYTTVHLSFLIGAILCHITTTLTASPQYQTGSNWSYSLDTLSDLIVIDYNYSIYSAGFMSLNISLCTDYKDAFDLKIRWRLTPKLLGWVVKVACVWLYHTTVIHQTKIKVFIIQYSTESHQKYSFLKEFLLHKAVKSKMILLKTLETRTIWNKYTFKRINTGQIFTIF